MKRRNFISTLGKAAVVPTVLNGFSFRAHSMSPLLQALAAASSDDHVLVLIQLSGGNDGLNTVIPLDVQWDNLQSARNNIIIPKISVLKLNNRDDMGLHPSMTGMQQIYNDGLMAIIQGASYLNPSFSHFRATDIWLTASDSNATLTSGWAGRYLEYEYPNYPTGYPNVTMPDPLALQIGTTSSLALQGPAVGMGMTITDPTNFYNLVDGTTDPTPNNNYGHELSYIRQVAQQSDAYSSVIQDAAAKITVQSGSWPSAGKKCFSRSAEDCFTADSRRVKNKDIYG